MTNRTNGLTVGGVGCLTTDGSSAKHNNRVMETDTEEGDSVDTQGIRIRKLTPKECWRLMGFSIRNEDGTFDDSAFERAEKVNSNSQLYKQAGNSIVVDVLEYILKPIVK